MRYFYELERRLVHGFLVALVPLPIAIRFLHDDAALYQQLLDDEPHVEIRILAVAHTQGNVLEIAEQRQIAVTVHGR